MAEVIFNEGETAIIGCVIKDTITETLVDPDTVKITIAKEDVSFSIVIRETAVWSAFIII